ncbi:transglutaminase domain-containing protein [Winogradskyella maritima]|uniref:Transglutaminase domain-containing protein n=1 Tax=Winogradskyella maritima TaxID=1517766 RepID=A0ABV8AIK1_9FLAO|nr:transglutaminase domain-containing protein [Winogradskyella maritima]
MKCYSFLLLFIIAFQVQAQQSDFETINFSKADKLALKCKNESLKNISNLASCLTDGLTTGVERFRAVFKWVTANISNDYSAYYRNKRKRKRYQSDSTKLNIWNDDFKKVMISNMIKHRKTICTGYAYLVQQLAEASGLECEIVHGYGRTSMTSEEDLQFPNHSWNAVKLNGKWYLADPTWASGIPDPESNRFTFDYNDGLFLTNPKLFAVNHHPIDQKWALLNESPSYDDFLNAPILYGNAYRKLNVIEAPLQFHHDINKNESVTFEYELASTLDKDALRFSIDNGIETKTVKPDSYETKDNLMTATYTFHNVGFYDVHLLLENSLISTHTVRVRR